MKNATIEREPTEGAHYGVTLEEVCEKRPAYVPYGYTRAPQDGGCCSVCGCATGGHERDCEVWS